MSKRVKLTPKHSKKLFSKTAARVNKRNMPPSNPVVMRGGIRF
jgi:hypothetical protein